MQTAADGTRSAATVDNVAARAMPLAVHALLAENKTALVTLFASFTADRIKHIFV